MMAQHWLLLRGLDEERSIVFATVEFSASDCTREACVGVGCSGAAASVETLSLQRVKPVMDYGQKVYHNAPEHPTQLNSTQREFTDAGETPHCPHLFIKFKTKFAKGK